MHTYTHPFIPIHTYNNTQQIMLLLNMVLKICNFLLKTPLMGMALTPLYFNKFAIYFKYTFGCCYLRWGQRSPARPKWPFQPYENLLKNKGTRAISVRGVFNKKLHICSTILRSYMICCMFL